MLEVTSLKRFDRSLKRVRKRGKKMHKLFEIIEWLRREEELPARCYDHRLIGNYAGSRECHIEPDWLLIYRIAEDCLILEDTGSHSDLFED